MRLVKQLVAPLKRTTTACLLMLFQALYVHRTVYNLRTTIFDLVERLTTIANYVELPKKAQQKLGSQILMDFSVVIGSN